MDILTELQSKNNIAAHKLLQELEAESAESDALYPYFDGFLSLTAKESAFVRMRGFRLCCAQAQWDTAGKLTRHIRELLALLDDDKPTVVRQCLAALPAVLLYQPELSDTVADKLRRLNLSKYRDTLRPLIEKDIAALLEQLH